MKASEFKLMVLPFSSRLYSIAFRMLKNREESEDVLQDVYLKLWKMRADLAKYNSIEALCVRITRNICLDRIRRQQIERKAMEEEGYYAGQMSQKDPSDKLEKSERSEIMHRLINELPEPQRSLVYFRHIEGKEYHEIEALTDMKENAIRVSISRARKLLKEKLQKQYASWTR